MKNPEDEERVLIVDGDAFKTLGVPHKGSISGWKVGEGDDWDEYLTGLQVPNDFTSVGFKQLKEEKATMAKLENLRQDVDQPKASGSSSSSSPTKKRPRVANTNTAAETDAINRFSPDPQPAAARQLVESLNVVRDNNAGPSELKRKRDIESEDEEEVIV